MAKKRTLVPYYGKGNQALEAGAKAAMTAGDFDSAIALADRSSKLYKKRKATSLKR